MTEPDEDHFRLVASRMLDGYVIPFLGAGANLVQRPETARFRPGGEFLPDGNELAGFLAGKSFYPETSEQDLLHVSQYVDAMLGEKVLYQHLRKLFNADYPPNSLHRLLATLPPLLACSKRYPLIITTNYDDALERAFTDNGQKFDLVWYEAKHGEPWRKFLHAPPDGEAIAIDNPNEYLALSLETRSVILKLHGAVNRQDAKLDSYVITENNYIDYLSRREIALPMTLKEHMADCHFLFLGYSMRDWNLRVILNQIWDEEPLDVQSWAVQKAHAERKQNEIEEKLWHDRGNIDVVQLPLSDYVARLGRILREQTVPDVPCP
jgi:hypothetical protein